MREQKDHRIIAADRRLGRHDDQQDSSMQVEDSSGSASRDNAHPGRGGVQGDTDHDGVTDGDGVAMDSDMRNNDDSRDGGGDNRSDRGNGDGGSESGRSQPTANCT